MKKSKINSTIILLNISAFLYLMGNFLAGKEVLEKEEVEFVIGISVLFVTYIIIIATIVDYFGYKGKGSQYNSNDTLNGDMIKKSFKMIVPLAISLPLICSYFTKGIDNPVEYALMLASISIISGTFMGMITAVFYYIKNIKRMKK